MARLQGIEKRLVAGGAGCVSQSHSFTVTFLEGGVGADLRNWLRPTLVLRRGIGWSGATRLARRGGELSSAGSYFHCAPIGGNFLQKSERCQERRVGRVSGSRL
jgi:hypothetical protein